MKVGFRVEKRMSPIFWAGVVLQFNVVYMYSRSCVCTDREKKISTKHGAATKAFRV
jgi:hypothetical protein